MRSLAAVAVSVGLAACWTNSDLPPPQPPEPPPVAQPAPPRPHLHAAPIEQQMVDRMVQFKDEMCTCRDPACVMRVSDEMRAWSEQITSEIGDVSPKLTDEQTQLATEIGQAMGRCMQAAMSAGAPTP